MKYIKFYMRDKRLDVTLSMKQAERVIDSANQLVKILDDNGEWTGITVNKAEIKGTDHDFDLEKDYLLNNTPRIGEAEPSEEEKQLAFVARKKISDFINQMK